MGCGYYSNRSSGPPTSVHDQTQGPAVGLPLLSLTYMTATPSVSHTFFLGQRSNCTKGNVIKSDALPLMAPSSIPGGHRSLSVPQTWGISISTVSKRLLAPLRGQTPVGHQSHTTIFQNRLRDPHQTFGGRISKIGVLFPVPQQDRDHRTQDATSRKRFPLSSPDSAKVWQRWAQSSSH